MALARRAAPGVELVSVDSMQVYRGMDIGTAKPGAAERAEVRHHLIDVADPGQRFTVADFTAAALAALADIESRGHVAVLVGGTGLYLRAVIGDLDPPGEWPLVRAALEADADADGVAPLYARLQRLDPLAASRIEPGNRRRIVRALEVTQGSGSPFSGFGSGMARYPDASRFALAGLWLPRVVVAERIRARVGAMMAAGFLDEVRALAARPGGMGVTARQALGYKELLAHLEGRLALEAALEHAVRRTRAFSVRQRRWFRRDPRIRWYGAERMIVGVLPALLRQLEQCHP